MPRPLDYETASSHTIEVQATSTDGSSSSNIFTISVTDDPTDNPPPDLTHSCLDDFVELGSAIDDGSFDVGEWSNIIGNGLAQNIHAVLNDQNPVAADRWSAAETTSLIICRMASMS